MAHTKEEIIKMINLDEPNYKSLVKNFTSEDIPILVQLSQDNNRAVAIKAISCLGLVDSANALEGIRLAAIHSDPIYRVAAAQALKNKSKEPEAINLLESLLDDQDLGVKKFAINSTAKFSDVKLKNKLKVLSKTGTNHFIKTLAKENLLKINLNR